MRILLLLALLYAFTTKAQKNGTIYVQKKTKDVTVKVLGENQDKLYLNQHNSIEIIFSANCKNANVVIKGAPFTRKGNIYTVVPAKYKAVTLICSCNGIEIYRKSYVVTDPAPLFDSIRLGP